MSVVKNNIIISSVWLVSYLLLLAVSASPAFSSEGPSSAQYGVVLNLSGKQRMLTQKMSKEIMLIALNVEADKNLSNLQKTSGLFDKTLKGLRTGSDELKLPPTTSKRILRQLDKIDSIWVAFYPVVQDVLKNKAVSKENIAFLADNNIPLLKNMNKAVGMYEKDAKKGGLKAAPGLAATINLAGKQRMLTQKMSKEFLFIAYGHDVENNKLSLLETHTLFERTLKGLLDGDDVLGLPGTKSAVIRDQLGVVDGLWKNFKPIVAFASDPKTAAIPKDKIIELANTNLPLLKNMNKAVGMYEKEAAK
ncbi:MAG: type IV pili methyl-accepting chemotaxis transducer N-terminal domain-containing protein [gamma proteobacterium symbiont of Taylorina sp.]|nr:type IV pili methyl-accepting chemotaxis transducer N-terminal domain-containing protein [gamma proteobacterium symbiont of Taylorina sp.]